MISWKGVNALRCPIATRSSWNLINPSSPKKNATPPLFQRLMNSLPFLTRNHPSNNSTLLSKLFFQSQAANLVTASSSSSLSHGVMNTVAVTRLPNPPKVFSPNSRNHSIHVSGTTTPQTPRTISNTHTDPIIVAQGPDGTEYAIPSSFPIGRYKQKRYAPKISPSIVQKRISVLQTTVGKRRSIRGSPWRIRLICQFLAGQTVPEALSQLAFVQKARAPLLHKVLKTTVDNARIQHGLVPSQLEVVECFATPATPIKRLKIMGRGRSGEKRRKFTHVRIVLREIDFPLKLLSCSSYNERQQWIRRMNVAMQDAKEYAVERDELEKLEQQVKALEEGKKKMQEKK